MFLERVSRMAKKIPLRIAGIVVIGAGGLALSGCYVAPEEPVPIVNHISQPPEPTFTLFPKTPTPTYTSSPTIFIPTATRPIETATSTATIVNPTHLSVDVIMEKTRVVLHAEGKTSTFREQGEFTNELYERVLQSTFIGEYWMKSVYGYYSMSSTFWLYEGSDPQKYSFLTFSHAQSLDTPKKLTLWRLSDSKKIEIPLSNARSANDGKREIYMVQIPKRDINRPLIGLPAIPDYTDVTSESKFLVVGSPLGFKESSPHFFDILADVRQVLNVDPEANRVVLDGVAQERLSGAPAVLVIQGNPYVALMIQGDQTGGVADNTESGHITITTAIDLEKLQTNLQK